MSHQHEMPTHTDVLVVGHGPVGAALACFLGRQGVQTLVIDPVADILQMPRAIALDNEALRILQMAGLDEMAFARIVIPEVLMHCPQTGMFNRVNTSGYIDGHPKLVTFYQPELERALRAEAARHHCVSTQAGWVLTSFSQDQNGVRALIEHADGQMHAIRARYLIGADGASSRVRSLIGQDFKGQTYSEDWLIVDAAGREAVAIDHVEFLCDTRRPTPHMPAPGGRERWEFMLQPGETREDMERPDRIAELLKPWIKPEDLQIERKAVYRFHARCCDCFQQGRVFLAGDAAHITPPFVGQGLVAGLRDAANLSWKLAWVLHRGASPEILDSYDRERRPHARSMINLAKQMGQLVMPSNRAKAFMVHGSLRVLRLIPPLRTFFEELKVKPANRFDNGLFVARRKHRRLMAGAQLPQAMVRLQSGAQVASDEVLGDAFSLIGFGVDPQALLPVDLNAAWRAVGGQFVQIGDRRLHDRSDTVVIDDTDGTLVTQASKGWLVVCRPDRVIMDMADASDVEALLQRCLVLLGK